MEEAVEAAKGFQVIPNCLFDRNIQFWQCTDCNQLYWEVFISFFIPPFFSSFTIFTVAGNSIPQCSSEVY